MRRPGWAGPHGACAFSSPSTNGCGAFLFVLLLGLTVALMRRDHLALAQLPFLGIIGNLALAWLIVALASRLIRNVVLRTLVNYGAWAWITLRIPGLTDDAAGLSRQHRLLDGGRHAGFSVWIILQALLNARRAVLPCKFASRTVPRHA